MFNKYLYLTAQRLYGENIVRDLAFLNQSQWWSRDRLEQFQLQKLQQLLTECMQSNAYYQNTWNKLGFHPKDVSSLDDLRMLPVLTKEEYRRNYAQLNTGGTGSREIRKTSGTTGLALKFAKSKNATSLMRALDVRSYGWHGISLGDRQARFWSESETLIGRFKQKFFDSILNRYRCSVLTLNEDQVKRLCEKLKRLRPDYVYGYVSGIYEFSKIVISNGLELPKIKAVIVTSEMMFAEQQMTIEAAFRAKAVREYGSTEFGMLALECEHGSYHIMDENVIVENEGNYADGSGDILVTELNNTTMPFIRYRIGDVGEVSKEKCKCGRNLTMLNAMNGRINTFIRMTDGKLVYDNIFDFIIGIDGVEQIQVLLHGDGKITVQYVGKTIASKDVNNVIDTLKKIMNKNVVVAIENVHVIPADRSGKRNYFKVVD